MSVRKAEGWGISMSEVLEATRKVFAARVGSGNAGVRRKADVGPGSGGIYPDEGDRK